MCLYNSGLIRAQKNPPAAHSAAGEGEVFFLILGSRQP
ncbi:hypothetical protein KR50_23930 [Jeotgalibacillus campisalis]|uniref:Uncharacterized protein n=1 Tax=Jeotgalibacillus campisalis TaxID=220754 RepID=A0A0C2VRL2_9BACL|nr:hypothetical protein KR50_23930 [Jeotgalibacillus campisalis]